MPVETGVVVLQVQGEHEVAAAYRQLSEAAQLASLNIEKGTQKGVVALNSARSAAQHAAAAMRLYGTQAGGGHKEAAIAAEKQAAAEKQLTAQVEREAQAEKERAAAIKEQRRADLAGFGMGASMVGGPLGGLLSRGAGLAGALDGGGAFAAVAGMALSAGAAIAQAMGKVALAAVRILVAEVEFLGKATLAVGAAAGAAALAFGGMAVSAALQRDTAIRGLTAILGSKEAAEAELSVLREIAKSSSGINLDAALKGAVQMRAVGMELGKVNRLLKEFGNLNALIGGSTEMMERVTLQFAQMAGKGKVTGEEIRALANDLPPLLGVMKQVFGTTSAEDITAMGVSFEEFSTKILAAMEAGPRATSGMRNAIVNLKDTWTQALAAMGQPLIGDATIALFDALAQAIANLTPYIVGLSEVVASYIPGITKSLEGMITPEAIRAFMEKLVTMSGGWETWVGEMLSVGADLVEGVGSILSTIVANFADFQEIIDSIVLSAGKTVETLAWAKAGNWRETQKELQDLLAHPNVPQANETAAAKAAFLAAQQQLVDRMKAEVEAGRKAEQIASAFTSLRAAAEKAAASGEKALRSDAIQKLAAGIESSSMKAAMALRAQAKEGLGLSDALKKMIANADAFLDAEKRKNAELDKGRSALDEQAAAARRVAEAYKLLTTNALAYSAAQAQMREQNRTEMGALAMQAGRRILAGAAGAQDPQEVISAGVKGWRQRMEEQLALQRDHIVGLKRGKERIQGQEGKTTADYAIDEAQAKLEKIENQWRVFMDILGEVTQAGEKGIAAQRRYAEEAARLEQKRLDDEARALEKWNSEVGRLFSHGMKGAAEAAKEAQAQLGNAIQMVLAGVGEEFMEPIMNEALKTIYQLGGNVITGKFAPALQEQLDALNARHLFVSNTADKAGPYKPPDLASQVFGNLGLGDSELMVQAMLDQQARTKELIIGSAETAGDSLAHSIAEAIARVLPREVQAQLAGELEAQLGAAH